MMHCLRCNLDFADNHKFCKSCGGRLLVAPAPREQAIFCQACGAAAQAGWRFCKKCRAPINAAAVNLTAPVASIPTPVVVAPNTTMVPCRFCGSAIEANSRFCDICGRKLSVEAVPDLAGAETVITRSTTAPVQESVVIRDVAVDADDGSPVTETEQDFGVLESYQQPATPFWKNIWVMAPVAAGIILLLAAGGGLWYWRSKQKAKRAAEALARPLPTPNPISTVAPVPEAPTGMVYIPGGTFSMGRDDGDEYDRPAHETSVAPFFMDRFEVTCEEYQKFVDEKNYPAPSTWSHGKAPAGSDRLPVTGVSWKDAAAYAEWANKRLPTEEEWEFAARGYDGRLYPWGKDWNTEMANVGSASGKLIEVGSRPQGASPFGLQDMVGNAWEWTSSQIQAYPGSTINEDSLPEAQRRNLKIIRGGSYQSNAKQATVTYRMGWPAQGASSYAQSGFRCAKDIDRH